MRGRIIHRCDGILLANFSTATKDNDFVKQAIVALKLIEQNDPRHYKRVKRNIRALIQVPLAGAAASYPWPIRLCTIDTTKLLNSNDENDNTHYLAGVLVHESTHGAVCRKGIRNYRKDWRRIEKLCFTEQNRFLAKVNAKPLYKEFDASWWQEKLSQGFVQSVQMQWAAFDRTSETNRRID